MFNRGRKNLIQSVYPTLRHWHIASENILNNNDACHFDLSDFSYEMS
jgi:hypothetical protein